MSPNNAVFYDGPLVTTSYARESAGATDADIHAFRRISGGDDRPDSLDQQTFERYQRLASWLYYQNPLARRLCDVVTDMVHGGGIKIDVEKTQLEDDDAKHVKELIDRFLTHPATEFDLRLPGFFTTLASVTGELFLPAFVHPVNGDLALGYLEHHQIDDIRWNPNNRLEPVAVIQRDPGGGTRKRWWNVIRARQGADNPMFPAHPSLSSETPALPDGQATDMPTLTNVPDDYDYAGELFYFRTNTIGTGRGRSRLEPALDWLHAYDNFLFGDLRNANMQAAFVWDVTIEGADLPALQEKAAQIRANPPRPGEVNVHNEKETWEALSPNLNAASHAELGVQVKKVIGLSMGLPPHLIGAEDNTNRSSGASSDIPFLRRMEQMQRLLRYVVQTILDYQLDQKYHAKVLPEMTRPYPYTIVLPSLTAGEIVGKAEALFNMTESVLAAVEKGVTCMSEARRIWYTLGLGEEDVPADLDKKVKQDRDTGLVLDPVKQAEKELEAKQSTGGNPPGSAGAQIGPRKERAKTSSGAPGGVSRGRG